MTTIAPASTGEHRLDDRRLLDPAIYAEAVPHDRFRALRAQGPVVWCPPTADVDGTARPGFWAVLGHAELTTVLREPRRFSSWLGLTQVDDAPPPLREELRDMMINMDPPDHTQLRGALGRAFTPRALEAMAERTWARARSLVDEVTAAGACDLAAGIGAELALSTLADVLGIPQSDRWLMYDWSNRVVGRVDGEHEASNVFVADAASPMARRALAARPTAGPDGRMPDSRHPAGMADLYAYARELGVHRRRHPGDDVMSGLVARADGGDPAVTAARFEKMFWLFCVAGNETVRNAVSGMGHLLATDPRSWAALAARPELVPTAVEEVLRHWSPVVQFRRTVVADTELGGARLRAGDKVVTFFSAADRDEAVFDDPDRFDPYRDPNPHVAFGHGPHFCIGAQLARLQMRVLLTVALRRWAEVAPAGEPERLRSNFQNGLKHLPLTFTPR